MPFVIIFVVIPLVELGIFSAVSGKIGLGSALIFALLTAILGGSVVRMQGMQTLLSVKTTLNKGGLPAAEIFDGFCIVAAGALLITPGFLTDFIGFALLVPPLRDALRVALKKHAKWSIHAKGFSEKQSRSEPYGDDIIEGEYETIDPEQDAKSGNDADKRLR